jgi:acetyl esterase
MSNDESAVVDPELAALAPMLPRADFSDLAATRALEARFLAVGSAPETSRTVETVDVRTVEGVTLRLFQHPGARPRPAVIFLRASAYALGSLDSADRPGYALADDLDLIAVTVDYRLAPQHPYPAALDDCSAALRWATSAAARAYGIDPRRVAVVGESAGGGLALALALRAKQEGAARPVALLLDAPTIDDRCDTPSMREFAETPMWRGADCPILWDYYLGDYGRGSDDVPLLAAPARATAADLAGLPPTWLATYQVDPTRDEALRLARRLIEAGVPTELVHHAGAYHLAHTVPGTRIGGYILNQRNAALRRLLPGL